MKSQPNRIIFKLPDWIDSYCEYYNKSNSDEDKMDFVIGASRKNVEENTGGPFAAAIFERDTGELVSLGVNLVTTQGLSILHAEMVAISVAQRKLKSFDLGDPVLQVHELVTSTEPCAMCFGAIPWSGVKRIVTGAFDRDARDIGFNEGPKPSDWIGALNKENIAVTPNIRRDQARKVLQLYKSKGKIIY